MRPGPAAWWSLSRPQQELLARHVRDRRVIDFGAGDCTLAAQCLELGAVQVVAVDSYAYPPMPWAPAGLVLINETFARLELGIEPDDVGLVSWPVNHATPGLLKHLERLAKVVYLGRNYDGASCGNAKLYRHLRQREILGTLHERPNALIVYGRQLAEPRTPQLLEERAALDQSRMYFWDDAGPVTGAR